MGLATGAVAAATALVATGSAASAAKAGTESVAQSIPGVGGAMALAEGNPQEAFVRNSADTASMVGTVVAGAVGSVGGGPLGTAVGAAVGNVAFGFAADEILRGWARHVQGYTDVAPSAGENLVRSAGNAVANGVQSVTQWMGFSSPAAPPVPTTAPAPADIPAAPLPAEVQAQAQAARPAQTPVTHDKEAAPTPESQTVPNAKPPERQEAAVRQ